MSQLTVRGSLFLITAAVLFLAGCNESVSNIDTTNDEGKAVLGLDYRDFDQAAAKMVQSMIASGAFDKSGGGRYVVAVSSIKNDTMQRIDTSQLMAKIEQELLNSGRVVMTSAVGTETDALVHESRQLRESDEFDQSTVAARGQMIAPELSISGKIIQRNIRYDSNKQQVEYYFQLSLADITSGLRLWQNEEVIGKRGSNRLTSW